MSESKVVHFNLFRPDRALFKSRRNDKAEIQIITCSNSENCELLKRGECACRRGLFGSRCVYGGISRRVGFTSRAQKYNSWCNDRKQEYDGVPFLKDPKAFGVVGDYIFLPYRNFEDIKNGLPIQAGFIKTEDFTAENVIKLAEGRFLPRYAIRSHQEKVSPLFLKHLSEQMPGLFNEVMEKSEFCRKRFAEFTNIGRKAVLQTLTPNVGTYRDIHGGDWVWDGERLHSDNSHMSFGLCKFTSISMVPASGQVVKVTDEAQVGDDTKFVE